MMRSGLKSNIYFFLLERRSIYKKKENGRRKKCRLVKKNCEDSGVVVNVGFFWGSGKCRMIVGGEKEIGNILGGQPTSGAVNVPVTPSAYVRSGHLSLRVGHPLDWLTLPNPKRLRLELSAELICCWAGHFRQS